MNKLFFTDNGISVPAITTVQMREVDRVAIEETGPNLFQMMENAGRNLALSAIDMLGAEWQNLNVAVLAGTGGNGGGGICAARHLANRNVKVTLCITEHEKLGTVPAYQRKIFGYTPGLETIFENVKKEKYDLIIDAIIGYSLIGAPKDIPRKFIEWADLSGTQILSLDIPSGLNAATGQTPGKFIRADKTLTLALPKAGLISEIAGEIFLADIGIPSGVYKKVGINYESPFLENYIVRLHEK